VLRPRCMDRLRTQETADDVGTERRLRSLHLLLLVVVRA
jgi:hypothetical protein